MKLDSQSAYHHPCLPHELGTKVIHRNDNPFILAKDRQIMINILNIGNEASKKGKYGLLSPVERKSLEALESPKQYLNSEDSINGNKDDCECNGSLCTDKIITQVEFAERGTCNGYGPPLIVKDISIDEAQSFGTTLMEKEQLGEMKSSIACQSLDNEENDTNTKMANLGALHDSKYKLVDTDTVTVVDEGPGGPAFVVYLDSDVNGSSVVLIDGADEEHSDELMKNNASSEVTKNQVDEVFNVHDGRRFSVSSIDSRGKQDITESVISNLCAEITGNQLILEEIGTDLSIVGSSSFIFSYDQKPAVEKQMTQGLLIPSVTSHLGDGPKEVLAFCDVPSEVMTSNFDNQGPPANSEESNETSDDQQSEEAQNFCVTEGSIIGTATGSAASSFQYLIQGESTFFAPAFLSGPIGNSGHIPYSGSISIRSDTSNTSARSFAFPVLQREWNGSPVKMAKADRRQLRKHHGWRTGLLCCRF